MTIELKYILIEVDRVLSLKETSSITPAEVITQFRRNNNAYMVVANTTRWYTLALSRYVTRITITDDMTWTDCVLAWANIGLWPETYVATNPDHNIPIPKFADHQVVIGNNLVTTKQTYVTDDPAYPFYKTPKVCGCDHDGRIRTFYGNPTSTYPVTRPFWRFHKDIVFSSEIAGGSALTFTNCIPICGGIAYYPVVYDDQLYAKDAIFSTWPTYRRNLNYFLVDFTPVGGMTTIKFSDCLVELHNDWVVVTLPGDAVTTNKSILVSLFGRLMSVGKVIRRASEKILMIPISLLQTKSLGLNYRRTTERTVRNTMAVTEPTDPTSLLTNLNTQMHHFITIVNTAKLYESVLNETMRLTNNVRRFPLGSRGLVRNTVTGHIQDYALLDFNTDTIIVAQDERPLLVPKGQQVDHPMRRVGILHTRCGYDKFHNLHDSPWCMFEWVTTEELIAYAT